MIFLFLLCLVRVESVVVLDSRGVNEVTKSNVRRIRKSSARAEQDTSFDELLQHRLHSESILRRLVRSAEPNQDSSISKCLHLSPLCRFAEKLLDSAWVHPPISKYLITVVIPGMVINHGKVAELGQMRLNSVTHERTNSGESHTNMTIFHENLKTIYKYNLDGPKGHLEVIAPSRLYFVRMSSKQEGQECITKISDLSLEKEEDLEFSSHGKPPEELGLPMKFVEHVLILESRRTAFYNIEAAIKEKLQTVNPPFCQEIE